MDRLAHRLRRGGGGTTQAAHATRNGEDHAVGGDGARVPPLRADEPPSRHGRGLRRVGHLGRVRPERRCACCRGAAAAGGAPVCAGRGGREGDEAGGSCARVPAGEDPGLVQDPGRRVPARGIPPRLGLGGGRRRRRRLRGRAGAPARARVPAPRRVAVGERGRR